MTALTTKRRNSLPRSEFALPATRQYPVDTKNRAANAKARATQQEEKGNITPSQKAKIDRKANSILRGKKVGHKRKIGLLSM